MIELTFRVAEPIQPGDFVVVDRQTHEVRLAQQGDPTPFVANEPYERGDLMLIVSCSGGMINVKESRE